MLKFHFFRGLKPTERRLILLSAMGICICLYLLNFYQFAEQNISTQEQDIGKIVEAKLDIRVKNKSQVLWKDAKKNQGIKAGDKIYTGAKSEATISLSNNSRIELKENSLVEFKKFRNEKIADFSEGEYRIAVSKNLKVAVNGKITEIRGDSEVVLSINKNKTLSIKTLSGAPEIQYQKQVVTQQIGEEIKFEPEPIPKMTEVAEKIPVRVQSESKAVDYYLGMYDVYERTENLLKVKETPVSLVKMSVDLAIDSFDSSLDIEIEHAQNKDLIEAQKITVDSFQRTLSKVYLGDNYWHCKQSDQDWSPVSHFFVRTLIIPNSKTKADFKSTQLFLADNEAQMSVSLQSEMPDINGFIVESSRKSAFDSNSVIFWSYQKNLDLKFVNAGKYYYRFRAVDSQLKLGEWSETQEINVIPPVNLSAPLFAKDKYHGMPNQSLFLSWNTQDDVKNYKIKIFSSDKNPLLEKIITDPFMTWTPLAAGNYRAEVRSLDTYNRASEPGTAQIEVKEIEIKVVEKRDLASDELAVTTKIMQQSSFNMNYLLSRFYVGTGLYAFNSKPMSEASVTPAGTPGLYIDSLTWFDHHGVQGILQKNFSSGGDNSSDFYSAEFRYHYRLAPSSRFSLLEKFHFSPYVGYEIYKNSSSTYLLSSYSMLKLGLSLEFPLIHRWAVSLLADYGNSGSLTKYQAAWDVSYFFKAHWTMGFGYKFNLLQGTTSQFQNYTDYREGYSLGQFNLKYYF